MSELGRREPGDWVHVEQFPLRALIEDPTHEISVPEDTDVSLGLPRYWRTWDQGAEGACVGFGTSAMMGVTNTRQHRIATGASQLHRYAPRWLYAEAQLVDEWPDTPPGQGTSVRAACDILRRVGHRRVRRGVTHDPDQSHGISANRWAVDVNEIRGAIHAGLAVSIGVNWYTNFDSPEVVGGERWVGRGALGSVRGGHCVCLFRMSDRRQAFRLMNSWGAAYPPVWIPYPVMQRLLGENGEAAVITDR